MGVRTPALEICALVPLPLHVLLLLLLQVDRVLNSLLDAFDAAEDHKEEYFEYRNMLLDDQCLDIDSLGPAFKAKVGGGKEHREVTFLGCTVPDAALHAHTSNACGRMLRHKDMYVHAHTQMHSRASTHVRTRMHTSTHAC